MSTSPFCELNFWASQASSHWPGIESLLELFFHSEHEDGVYFSYSLHEDMSPCPWTSDHNLLLGQWDNPAQRHLSSRLSIRINSQCMAFHINASPSWPLNLSISVLFLWHVTIQFTFLFLFFLAPGTVLYMTWSNLWLHLIYIRRFKLSLILDPGLWLILGDPV